MLKKNKKGSALVVALFILAMILISALSITLITVKERLASIGSAGSNRAYQASETGIESVMQLIMKGNHEYIDDGGNSLNSSLVSIGASCVSGLIEDTNYKVELLDNTGNPIPCDANNTPVSDIVKIKSVGESSNSKRAVEALVSNKNTKLLMHFDGEDPPIDSSYSYYEYSITNTGSVSFSNSSPILNGTKYAEFSAGDHLKIEDSDPSDSFVFDLANLTDKDFTIETWVYFNPKMAGLLEVYDAIVSQWDSQKQFRFSYERKSGKLVFEYSEDGSSETEVRSEAVSLSSSRWYHVAVERKSNDIYFFVDGVERGSGSIGTEKINDRTGKDVYVGTSLDGNASPSFDPNYQFIGNMDELRITKGVARYPTSGFTRWENVEYVPNI